MKTQQHQNSILRKPKQKIGTTFIQEHCDSERGKAIQHSATVREVCAAWEMEDVFDEEAKKLELNEIALNNRLDCKRKLSDDDEPTKKAKEDGENLVGDDVEVVGVKFVR